MSSSAQVAALDATGQAEVVRRGEVTAVEPVEWGIEALDPLLHAASSTAR